MTTHFMYMSHLSLLLLVLFYLPVCLGVLWFINFILRKIPLWKALRVGVCLTLAVPMFLWPTWDAILGKHYLDQLCEKDGGFSSSSPLHIAGFYMSAKPSSFTAKQILNQGYEYFEMGDVEDQYIHYTLDSREELFESPVKNLMSDYEIKSDIEIEIGIHYDMEYKLDHYYVESLKSDEIFSNFRNYYFYGGYIDRIVMSAFGKYPIGCTEIDETLGRNSAAELIMPRTGLDDNLWRESDE